MGEVYKARDTRLHRLVAIKVSMEQFSMRFEHEARAVAALNHPHICQLYDVGPDYLVMEFVEGAPLEGPLPLQKTVEYAAQILDALDAAHQKGITHRDLKPANILVTKQGIKLLDFGLAKQATRLSEGDVTKALTDQGQIVGTLQYMSPEQLQGKQADARSDLFSFGCVLYELFTGERAFNGTSAASLIAAILEREPAPLEIAQPLDRVVRRSLAKDPDQRFQTARDLKAALTWALEQPAQVTAPSRSRLGWVAASTAVLIAGVLGVGWWRSPRALDRPLMRLNVDLGPDAMAGRFTTTAISPNGARLVFPVRSADGTQMLATRLLDETNPAALSGTQNGRDPFFSPDGKWVGFFADGKIKKISAQGGAPIVLCQAPDARGGTWGEDGNIIVALNATGALSRVPSEGGLLQPVTKLQAGVGTLRWPQFLPGNEAVLITASASIVAFEDASIAAASLKTGDVKILVRNGYFGRYLPTGNTTGHLVYVHQGVLFAIPFDPKRLELRGSAVPILEDLAGDPNSGAGQFSFSQGGTLVYRTGKVSEQSWIVSWLDGSRTRPLIATPGFYLQPHFSPDGQRLALSKFARTDRDVFVYDLQRDTMTSLTVDDHAAAPIWSPDGKHIAFGFNASNPGLGWVRADGAGEIQRLLDTKNIVNPFAFFAYGRRLAYIGLDTNGRFKIYSVTLDVSDPDHPKPGKPELFLDTQNNERYPALSPDGRWIAYESDESGIYEVYVRSFPAASGASGGKWQISIGGGALPIWSRNGRELFFQNPDHRIMVTDYEVKNESFGGGKPRVWSDQRLQDISGLPNYDLAPDGKRFAVIPSLMAPADDKGAIHMTFLLNFFDEVRRRVPAGK
jgi:Tol biopolymer transport system component